MPETALASGIVHIRTDMGLKRCAIMLPPYEDTETTVSIHLFSYDATHDVHLPFIIRCSITDGISGCQEAIFSALLFLFGFACYNLLSGLFMFLTPSQSHPVSFGEACLEYTDMRELPCLP